MNSLLPILHQRDCPLLDKTKIEQELRSQKFNVKYSLFLTSTINSTNSFLQELEPCSELVVCLAEQQTHGRGRFNRYWHSPFGQNIYCSSRWHLKGSLKKLSGLSLVVSLAVLAMLRELFPNINLNVKWPNDVLYNGKKLCGSLIEVIPSSNGEGKFDVIIGIGLNVNSDTAEYPLEIKPWCSLFDIMGECFDRNIISARLVISLNNYLNRFLQHGLGEFIDEWNQADCLNNNKITVSHQKTTLSGIACGINELGFLMLKDDLGVMHCLSSGDTTFQGLSK